MGALEMGQAGFWKNGLNKYWKISKNVILSLLND